MGPGWGRIGVSTLLQSIDTLKNPGGKHAPRRVSQQQVAPAEAVALLKEKLLPLHGQKNISLNQGNKQYMMQQHGVSQKWATTGLT